MALVMCFGLAAHALEVQVAIYTNDAAENSYQLYCSSYIHGSGANDISSSNSLYYQIYKENGVFDIKSREKLMAPGFGVRTGTTTTFITIYNNITVPDGNGNYYIRLNVQGANYTGCNGAGRLID